MAKLLRPRFLFPLSLVLGWLFDFLFWGKSAGISFPIITLALLGAGFWLAASHGLKPARAALWLALPIALLALVSVVRVEPMTIFVSRIGVVLLSGLLAITLVGGQWPQFGFADYLAKYLAFIPTGLGVYRQADKGAKKSSSGTAWAVGRGLLFALPLLLFLAILLGSADPIFGAWLENLFSFIDDLPQTLWRIFLIVVLAYAFAGAYSFALNRSQKHDLLGADKPLVAPFVGFTEAATMLGSVLLLFAAFVVVQFRYFFGGAANIVPDGYTYAEYARRGFGELIVVAVVSLGFFILLSALSRRQAGSQQRWFSAMGMALFALVAVILASAFQRLLLLEQAYGFTRWRMYPHVFMVWLGLLLLAVVVLEARGHRRAFALATALAILGFGLTLPILNVDGLVARINVQRAFGGEGANADRGADRLDFPFLSSLSEDAVPALVDGFRQAEADGNPQLAHSFVATLACQFDGQSQPLVAQHWQSWTWSRQTAVDAWTALQADPAFPGYTWETTDRGPGVTVSGQHYYCFPLYID